MDEFRTIEKPAYASLQRERSRFLAFAFPVTGRDDVEKCLQELEQEYPDATHHCYAYRLAEENRVIESGEDAGEPSGSAGRPILQVITGHDLMNILVVVVRYFGGVKLGLGGLMRAYSDATKAVLELVRVVQRVREMEISLRYPHACTGEVMRLVNRYRAQIVQLEYRELPLAVVRLPAAQVQNFERDLRDATRGQVELVASPLKIIKI